MDDGFFDFQHYSRGFSKNFSRLDNLKSLSFLSIRHGDDVEKLIFSRVPGIQKLGCRFYVNSWDHSPGCKVFPAFERLSELISLKMFFSGKVLPPCKFSFPWNLRKLTMSSSRLPWDQLSVIGRELPNLEVLKLLNKAFEGQQWDMKDDEFQNLKFLKLEGLDIQFWNAFAEHLPRLQQLVVQCCPRLEGIPSCLGEIPTLELIELKWCSSSAMDSAKGILEVQRDLCNYQLNVTLFGSA